jgi:hypothetical protein
MLIGLELLSKQQVSSAHNAQEKEVRGVLQRGEVLLNRDLSTRREYKEIAEVGFYA